MRRLYLVDSIIVWVLQTYTAASEPVFEYPQIIKGRWDTVKGDATITDRVETLSHSVTVYPDRVLSVGSVLMLGDEETLEELTPQEIKNPLLLSTAVTIKSQSTIAEFGRPQKANYPVGFQSKYLTIECQC